MKQFLITVMALCLAQIAWSQSIERAVMGSAGKIEDSSDLRLEWTLGEVAVQHYAPGRLSEGFHQPVLQLAPHVATSPYDNLFEVFPNPTGALLHVRGNLPDEERVLIRLVDISGKPVALLQPLPGRVEEQLDLSDHPPGMYQLIISDPNGNILRTERIVKQ